MRNVRSAVVGSAMLAVAAVASGCVAIDPSDPAARYSIQVVTWGEALVRSGRRDSGDYTVNYTTRPEVVRRTIAANPGLAEALRANGVRFEEIATIRILPAGIVRVFTR